MNREEFDKLLQKRLKATVDTLSSKNKEYASDTDKLHNFKRAGRMLGCTPERALVGMLVKHLVSLLDIVDKIELKKELPTKKLLDEKCGDSINYVILLEALIEERLNAIQKS